jgi:hypothetical protein
VWGNGTGRRYLELYTVTRIARDFKVIRLSDEFGQHLLYLKYASCGHERQSFPDALAHRCTRLDLIFKCICD